MGWRATVDIVAKRRFGPGAFNGVTLLLCIFLTVTVEATARTKRIRVAIYLTALRACPIPHSAVGEAYGLVAKVITVSTR